MSTLAIYEIPLSANPQTFTISMNGTSYEMTLKYRDCDQGGWILDIADSSGNAMVRGIPLVTGIDLLGQYGYLGFGVGLFVTTDGDMWAPPTFDNLGSTSHLYFTVES